MEELPVTQSPDLSEQLAAAYNAADQAAAEYHQAAGRAFATLMPLFTAWEEARAAKRQLQAEFNAYKERLSR
jgi:hypothetical protein